MYYVKSFDGLTLQTEKMLTQSDNIGPGQAINRYVQTPNGWYDNTQTGVAKRNINYITASRLFHYSDAATLRAAIEDWRAKIGTRGQLFVEWWDGTQRWTYARLDSVNHPAFVGDIGTAVVDLTWSTIEQDWRASSLTTVTQSLSGVSSVQMNINNPGDLTVYDVTITLATAGSMNGPTIENDDTGHGFQYDILFTGTLIVDTGAKTINKDYNYFDPYNKNIWFSLQPGANDVDFILDSGTGDSGSSIKFEFYARYG